MWEFIKGIFKKKESGEYFCLLLASDRAGYNLYLYQGEYKIDGRFISLHDGHDGDKIAGDIKRAKKNLLDVHFEMEKEFEEDLDRYQQGEL